MKYVANTSVWGIFKEYEEYKMGWPTNNQLCESPVHNY